MKYKLRLLPDCERNTECKQTEHVKQIKRQLESITGLLWSEKNLHKDNMLSVMKQRPTMASCIGLSTKILSEYSRRRPADTLTALRSHVPAHTLLCALIWALCSLWTATPNQRRYGNQLMNKGKQFRPSRWMKDQLQRSTAVQPRIVIYSFPLFPHPLWHVWAIGCPVCVRMCVCLRVCVWRGWDHCLTEPGASWKQCVTCILWVGV